MKDHIVALLTKSLPELKLATNHFFLSVIGHTHEDQQALCDLLPHDLPEHLHIERISPVTNPRNLRGCSRVLVLMYEGTSIPEEMKRTLTASMLTTARYSGLYEKDLFVQVPR